MNLSSGFNALKALMNDGQGNCFICKKSLLEHTEKQLLDCGESGL